MSPYFGDGVDLGYVTLRDEITNGQTFLPKVDWEGNWNLEGLNAEPVMGSGSQ